MDLQLKDKVAIVPASSSGLGRAVARSFGREGARVVMCSRDEAAIEEAAADVRATGAEVLAMTTDVTKPDAIEALISAAVGRFGGVDILVTNAGGPPAGTFDRFNDDDWQAAFNLTLMSSRATDPWRAAVDALRRRWLDRGDDLVLHQAADPEPASVERDAFGRGCHDQDAGR